MLIDKLSSIDSDLSKTIISSSFAVLGAALTLSAGKILEQRIKIKQDVREKKIPVYEEQMQTIFKILFSAKEGEKQLNTQEFENAFRAFTEKLIIWENSNVIKAWVDFRNFPWTTPEENVTGGFEKFEEFVFALRKDIGNDNKKLSKGDLLRLFINDYDSLKGQMPQQKNTANKKSRESLP